jgi:hypothetical protein
VVDVPDNDAVGGPEQRQLADPRLALDRDPLTDWKALSTS